MTTTPDPATDVAAARAFTRNWAAPLKDRMGRTRSTVCTWETTEPKRPRCWCAAHGHPGAFQCGNPAKATLADGSTWCGMHTPAAVARREAAKAERRRQEQLRQDAHDRYRAIAQRRRAAQAGALAALKEIAAGHNDPRTLAKAALAAYPPEDIEDAPVLV